MKVRLKSNWHPGYVREVQRTACLDGKDFYLFTDGTWCTSDSYEPIPTETWRDVSSECEFSARTDFPLGGYALKHNGTIISTNGSHYRLRKMVLFERRPNPPFTNFYDAIEREAFIVEKRETT
jgi:hypothetical protein